MMLSLFKCTPQAESLKEHKKCRKKTWGVKRNYLCACTSRVWMNGYLKAKIIRWALRTLPHVTLAHTHTDISCQRPGVTKFPFLLLYHKKSFPKVISPLASSFLQHCWHQNFQILSWLNQSEIRFILFVCPNAYFVCLLFTDIAVDLKKGEVWQRKKSNNKEDIKCHKVLLL